MRRKKDSSLVRAAEAVRDGKALAMVSAGNTGAAMASALLRMGRLKGVVRPAIATPIPQLGSHPAVLLDAGANAECTPAMLVQFAQMGVAYASARYGVEEPTVALLSIGEEKSKGTPLVKEAHELLESAAHVRFVGNVEGRDLLHAPADVLVTDGFTGNVALKTLEGSLRFFMDTLLEVFAADEEAKAAAEVMLPRLAPLAAEFDPDGIGGRRPAGRGRRVRHQPRLLQRHGHRLGACAWPTTWPRPGSSTGWPGPSPRAEDQQIPPLNRYFIGHGGWAR